MNRRSMGLGVPAYFHPAVSALPWQQLTKLRAHRDMVVFNVHNGPGDAPDERLGQAVSRVLTAGVRVVGYLDTDYGDRPNATLAAEAARYRTWYGITDVFLDRVASERGQLHYYETIADTARADGAEMVVFNHGVYPDPAFAEVADVLVTFEGTLRSYGALDIPGWAFGMDPRSFWHLVYDVPRRMLPSVLLAAAQGNVGTVFVTDRRGANPWDGLSSYLHQQRALLEDLPGHEDYLQPHVVHQRWP